MSDFGTIIQIGDVLISEEVVTEYFSCDYEKCKGCCCVVGDSGAPLREEETEELEREYPNYCDLMTPEGREAAQRDGFFSVDRDGELVTPVVSKAHEVPGVKDIPGTDGVLGLPGLEECAYCHFEKDGSCFCSIERRFFEGRSSFRKPVSCHLYPIRITKMPGGGEALNFHRWSICADAFEKGRREGTRVYQFLREPLINLYGQEFYDMLSVAAERINSI